MCAHVCKFVLSMRNPLDQGIGMKRGRNRDIEIVQWLKPERGV